MLIGRDYTSGHMRLLFKEQCPCGQWIYWQVWLPAPVPQERLEKLKQAERFRLCAQCTAEAFAPYQRAA